MSESLWIKEAESPQFPKLSGHEEAEVCVIGGGITGLLSAYYVSGAGKSVILLEKDRLWHGETGYTTAFITSLIDARYVDVEKKFGREKARRVAKSGEDAIRELERIAQEENIECEFVRCPAIFYAHRDKEKKMLQDETEAGKRAGLPLSLHAGTSFFPYGYMQLEGQAKFHAGKFFAGLVKVLNERGVKLYEQTMVTEFTGTGGNTVKTTEGSVAAHEIIEATNAPIGNTVEFPSRLSAMQSYIIETHIPSGLFREGIYWNTEDPYHYFRIDKGEKADRFILGGEDHETGQGDGERAYAALKTYMDGFLGRAYPVENMWSGQVLETPDGLPFIGRSITNSHHLVATGYAGNGMTFGTIAARLMTDLILSRENPLADIYSPLRLKGVPSFLEMGWNYVSHLVSGWLSPRKGTPDDVLPGEGKVISVKGQKIAVSRDEKGNKKCVSAVCTHLGCVVDWNTTEKTWDCPCHGSRFAADGKVMNGPATKSLKPIDL
jgi:glycine/D-amino acid oxidase-like deaminating enzyme/nitrite reductase/ring-hydroxylating ferredoxin subunit